MSAAGGGADDARQVYWTFDASAKTVTYYQIHPTNGSEGSQTVSLSSPHSPASYFSMGISWDGSTHAITEYMNSSSSSKTMRTFFIDFSGGVGSLSVLGTWDFTGNYYMTYNAASTQGKTFSFYHLNNDTRIYDISSSYSSPTLVTTYGPSDYSFGPRGGRYTPQGRYATVHGTDAGGVISQTNASTVGAFITQSWTGWNQANMTSNYDGSYHFYSGTAVNTVYFPFVRKFTSTGTSATNLGSDNSWTFRAQYCNMNEANDGNSLIQGSRIVKNGSNVWRDSSGTTVVDYTTNTRVYENTTSTMQPRGFTPDGKVILIDTSSGFPYSATILDPDNSFADITSNYHSDFITALGSYNPSLVWGSSANSSYWWPNATYSGLNSIYS